jgi:hypothetical protein
MYHTRLLHGSLCLQTADALAPGHADASAHVLATLRFHGIVESPEIATTSKKNA